MWKEVEKFFSNSPAKLKVARIMVELGLSINDEGRIMCGNVEISDTSIARAISIDRRVVRQTVKEIVSNERMKNIFKKIKPAGSFLKEVAPELGYGVLEIRAQPNAIGVIAKATSYIAEAGLSIRQILAEDPDLNPDPKLLIITDKKVPG
ncbi:MAG: hypothetical protein N3D72_01490, partial [Candidatus Methanomethyliaceae archaeon]|nr:hypothetical protein [Candidatus Methanomethyliaceae archaeon]